jgi:hypothetical protein
MLHSVDRTLEDASMDICRKFLPQGYSVSANAPNTLEEATDYFKRHGTVCVHSGFDPVTSPFRRDVGHYAFQAWHDLCHVSLQAPFDLEGERTVNRCMTGSLRQWHRENPHCTLPQFNRASAALSAWNVGRLQYWHAFKEPPGDARTFIEGYLAAMGLTMAPEIPHQYPREARGG